jgi:hypothetical protein
MRVMLRAITLDVGVVKLASRHRRCTRWINVAAIAFAIVVAVIADALLSAAR